MKERRLLLLLTFLPVALAVYIWELDVDFTSSVLPEQQEHQNDLPLTILEKAQITQFDQHGVQVQRVSSPELLSFELRELIQINQPTIELHTNDGNWTATSQNGMFYQNDNRITLRGDVTLEKHDASTPIVMLTNHLDYYPDSRLAETDEPVSIRATGHDIQSEGIRVDLTNSVYILTNRVRSSHVPL